MSVPPLPTPPATPYQIRTPRLLLRCYELSDIRPRLEAVESSGAHLHGLFPPNPSGPAPLEAQLAAVRKFRGSFDLDQDRVYAAVDPQSGRFLGEVCLLVRAGLGAREVGYWIRSDVARQGLTTEMASAAVRVAFELDQVKRVDLLCNPDNAGSAAVARKLGFTLEGRLRDRQLAAHHTRGDLLCFTLLSTEYPTSPARAVRIEAFDALGRPLL